jgi:hypothetical protein
MYKNKKMMSKYINPNCLSKVKYLIDKDLQIKLFRANNGTYFQDEYSNKNLKVEKNPIGLNVINFIILNKNNKSLVYNYVYYRPDFCESLIVYFVIRNYYLKRSREE